MRVDYEAYRRKIALESEVIVVRICDAADRDGISYEVRDENGAGLFNATSLDDAVSMAIEIAEQNDVEFIKIQVATETV